MSTHTETTATVRLERTIPATPHEVYRAWLDPELVSQWFFAGDRRVSRVEVDERVGGHHRIWHSRDNEPHGGFDCELLELVPDRRIVFLWRFVGPERDIDSSLDSRLTVSFDEAPGGGTTLSLVHEQLDAFAAAMPQVSANVEAGWSSALDNLEAWATRAPRGS